MTNKFATSIAAAALVISVLALFVALVALRGADSRQASPDAEASSSAAASTSTAAATQPVSGTDATTSTTAAASQDAAAGSQTAPAPVTAAPAPGTSSELPGEPSPFGPEAGAPLGIVGVRHSSQLNVRDVPNGSIVATLSLQIGGDGNQSLLVRGAQSDETVASLGVVGLTATGRSRMLRTSLWHEIRAGPVVGWSSDRYLAALSPSTRLDMTARVTEQFGAAPTAPSLPELGDVVAAQFAVPDGDGPSLSVSVAAAPSESAGVAEITLDLLGLPDDSLRGYRLRITAESSSDTSGNTDAQARRFTLRTVSATPLCYSHRGVSAAGTCR